MITSKKKVEDLTRQNAFLDELTSTRRPSSIIQVQEFRPGVPLEGKTVNKILGQLAEAGRTNQKSKSIFLEQGETVRSHKKEDAVQITVFEAISQLIRQTEAAQNTVYYDLHDHSRGVKMSETDNVENQKIDLVFFPKDQELINLKFVVSFIELKFNLNVLSPEAKQAGGQTAEVQHQLNTRLKDLWRLQGDYRPDKFIAFASDGKVLFQYVTSWVRGEKKDQPHQEMSQFPFIQLHDERYWIGKDAQECLEKLLCSDPQKNGLHLDSLKTEETFNLSHPSLLDSEDIQMSIESLLDCKYMREEKGEGKIMADIFQGTFQRGEKQKAILKVLPNEIGDESFLRGEFEVLVNLRGENIKGVAQCLGWVSNSKRRGLAIQPLGRPLSNVSSLLGVKTILESLLLLLLPLLFLPPPHILATPSLSFFCFLSYFKQIDLALVDVHTKLKIIHADVSPSNIVIFGDRPILIDWELAIQIDKIGSPRGTHSFWSLEMVQDAGNMSPHTFRTRDDFEALFFSLIYVTNRKVVPWPIDSREEWILNKFEEVINTLQSQQVHKGEKTHWELIENAWKKLFSPYNLHQKIESLFLKT